MIKQFPEADIEKGKMVINEQQGFKKPKKWKEDRKVPRQNWKPPTEGEAKLNVDGAFTANAAGVGMVLRDHAGTVIFTVCRSLDRCRDATEAELVAIEEGLKLSLHWTKYAVLARNRLCRSGQSHQ
jgi:hypothetical protein